MTDSSAEKTLREAQDTLGELMRELYDDFAATYRDHLRDDCQCNLPADVAKLLGPMSKTHRRFLELGVGPGVIGDEAEKAGLVIDLVGCDFSWNMLQQVNCPRYRGLIQLEATRPMPFPEAYFDGAIFIMLMEHIADPYLVLENVSPVVRTGGYLLFTFVPSKSDQVEMIDFRSTLMTHPREMVLKEVEATGFQSISERSVNAYIHGNEWITHHLILAVKR